MNPEYYSITFDTEGHNNEITLALLSDWPFESFQEEGDQIIGYILTHDITQQLLEGLDAYKGIWYKEYHMDKVEDRNWNEVWESSFNPVAIEDYCYIRAAFHSGAPTKFRHEIIIAPRMAFGTGHHATTYMMIMAMASLDFREKRVLDFGCGTGILSIMAAKEGAEIVTGIDTQMEAIENSIEHAALNGVSHLCAFRHGGLELVASDKFDIILANINVTVIALHFEKLKSMLQPGGYILLSGIMTHDKAYMNAHISFPPLQIVDMKERNEWVQLSLKK